MKKLFLAAGIAALAISMPAAAERGGKGNGKGAQAAKAERGGGQARSAKAKRQKAQAASRQKARAGNRQEARAQRQRNVRPDRQRAVRADRRGEQRAERQRNVRAERQRNARAERRGEQRAERQRNVRAERQRNARAERRGEQRVERQRNVRAERQRNLRAERMREARVERVREQRQAERRNLVQRQRDERRSAERFRDRREAGRNDRQRLARLNDRDFRFRDSDRFDRDRFQRRFTARGIPAGYVNGCPPGLAKQNALCMPPGQYRKLVGQRLPAQYRRQALPRDLRGYYRETDDYFYRYGNGYAYRVDRQDQLISAVLPLIGAGLGLGMQFPYSSPNYYVPSTYQPFYPDTSYSYHRYANGYVYEIDRNSGMIEDMIPLLDQGYGVGQMLPDSYSYYNLPYEYRSHYRDDDDYLYRYAPGAIYQVDRETRLITAIVSLLTGSGNGLAVGQPLPMGYDMYNVPYDYRDRYYDTPDSMYRYSNGNIYQVDPTTRLITAIVDAIV